MNSSIVMALCLFPGSREPRWDLSGLVQVRQSGRTTDQVDLWLSNPFPLPLTITNPRLARSSRGVLKVRWTIHGILITVS